MKCVLAAVYHTVTAAGAGVAALLGVGVFGMGPGCMRDSLAVCCVLLP
jgi:hypothetical protein